MRSLLLVLGVTLAVTVSAQDAPPSDYRFNTCGERRETAQSSPFRQLYRGGDDTSFEDLIDERVRIEATVLQYLEAGPETTDFYIVQDSYGVPIMVQSPTIEKPTIGDVRCIEGIVGYNTYGQGQQARTRLSSIPETIQRQLKGEDGGFNYINGTLSVPLIREQTTVPPPPPPCPAGQVYSGGTCVEDTIEIDWTWLLVGGGALLLLGLGAALVRTMRTPADRETATYLNERVPPTATQTPTRTAPAPTKPAAASPSPSAIDALLAESAPEVVEGKTIKIHRPTNQTLKVLPGRFVVTGGLDDLPEVRFFMPRGRTTTEITFGRSEGRPYEHVQLKPRTVSSRQATLVFDGGKYSLINHSPKDSNPTSVNGRDLSEGESRPLNDGDKITMGEVEFVYKAA